MIATGLGTLIAYRDGKINFMRLTDRKPARDGRIGQVIEEPAGPQQEYAAGECGGCLQLAAPVPRLHRRAVGIGWRAGRWSSENMLELRSIHGMLAGSLAVIVSADHDALSARNSRDQALKP